MGVSIHFNQKFQKRILRLLFALLVLFSMYHAYFADKIIPGVEVAGARIGGKTIEDAQKILEKELVPPKNLTFVDSRENLTFEIPVADVGLKYDIYSTLREAFLMGRSGNILTDNKKKIAGLTSKINIPAKFLVNDEILKQELNQIRNKIDIPALNAEYYLDDEGELQIKAEKYGQKLEMGKLSTALIYAIGQKDFRPISLPIAEDTPNIAIGDLKKLRNPTMQLLENPFILKHQDKTWEILPEEKLSFLKAEKVKGKTQLAIREEQLNQFMKTLAGEINILPRGKVVKESDDGKVLEFALLGNGIELDEEKFTTEFEKAFLGGKTELEVETKEIGKSADINKYGIKELIGYGESNYAGSSPSRASNLILAGEKASGVLVPPNGVYSFNKAVGPINAETGFGAAWIIAGGRTVLGTGGGACQTSTTLFRAVLNAGLPIVERHAHAYRVGYYEKDQPVGFDAAVAQPTWDMKFRNDTENYVLVQAYAKPEETKLIFKIYGTSDGRKVEISKPVITGETPPPAPLYQETASLKKGQIQQVDFSAWGATSVFSRKVTKDGKVLFEETYKSVYRPWQAVFLVGTAN